jgi:hypothetical protein
MLVRTEVCSSPPRTSRGKESASMNRGRQSLREYNSYSSILVVTSKD